MEQDVKILWKNVDWGNKWSLTKKKYGVWIIFMLQCTNHRLSVFKSIYVEEFLEFYSNVGSESLSAFVPPNMNIHVWCESVLTPANKV